MGTSQRQGKKAYNRSCSPKVSTFHDPCSYGWLKYMMLFIVLLSAVIIMVALYVLLTQQEGGNSKSIKASPRKKEIQPPKTDHLKNERKFPLEDIFSSEIMGRPASMAEELGVSDIYGDLRRVMQQGIETIFSGQNGLPEVSRMPLMYDDINSQTLRMVEQHIGNLKKFRTEHLRLQKLINDPAIQMSDLAKMVLADPILTAKILRLANSPYFGMQNKIDSISHALMILGIQNSKNILYREGLLQLFPVGSSKQKDALAALLKHSTLTSVCAAYLSDLFDGLNQGTLFTLGIIHDIGKLIILGMPQVQTLDSVFWDRFPGEISIHDEDELLGFNHAVIGRMAIEQWGFSDLMIHSVAMHHMPSYGDADSLHSDNEKQKYITALFVADQVAKLFAARNGGTAFINPLSESYHALVDRDKLVKKIADTSFLSKIQGAELVADSEYPGVSIHPGTEVKKPGHEESAGGRSSYCQDRFQR